MSKIIVFGNQKGGVGKTTATVLAATALSQSPFELKVLIIDTDHQKSIVKARLLDTEEYQGILPYDVLNYNVKTLQKNIQQLDRNYDLIFIDVPGKLDNNIAPEQQEISKVLLYADYLFVPFSSGNYTLDATLDYLKFVLNIEEARASTKRPLEIIGFINMYRERSRNNRFLLGEINQIKQFTNVPFMRNNLALYTLFSDANTIESLYDAQTEQNAQINFVLWLNEFLKIISY